VSDYNARSHAVEQTASPPSLSQTSENRHIFLLREVTKRWAGEQAFVLTVPELVIGKGEKIALVGMSGCGKSTLLDILAMVLRPDKAIEFAFFEGPDNRLDVFEAWRSKEIDRLAQARMLHMGYVLQTGGLLPFLSVEENIGLCREGLGLQTRDKVEDLAKRLGIERHLRKLPGQLSVGERQRVAIARAMAHDPSTVIADEPTASLDPINAEEIMALFTRLADEYNVTLIVATHDWKRVAERGFRRVEFQLDRNAQDGTVQATVHG
jgi:putative ABC transport system ATP-binding protein